MSLDQVATVKSWDPTLGRGVLEREGREDLEVTREQLPDASDLAPGQRVAFRQSYEAITPHNWDWVTRDVRAVSHEEAATLELALACDAVIRAEERLRTAREIASDEDVEQAREDLVKAQTERRSRVAEVGRQLYELGGAHAMGNVLERLGKHRSTVAHDWECIGVFSA